MLEVVTDKEGEIREINRPNAWCKLLKKYSIELRNVFQVLSSIGISEYDMIYLKNNLDNEKVVGCNLSLINKRHCLLISLISQPLPNNEISLKFLSVQKIKNEYA